MLDLTVIVLTLNEEAHIGRCLENVRQVADDMFVVDCCSTDGTAALAGAMGAKVFQNPWPGSQAKQLNWALENLPIKTRWVLRLDADEYLSPELLLELREKLGSLPEDVTGVVFPLRRIFLGRHIRHGMQKVKLLRLFRFGKARCEQRLMDEYVELLEGRSVEFAGAFADHNLHSIGGWTAKHNGYALREAVSLLDAKYGLLTGAGPGGQATLAEHGRAKRAQKRTYAKMPLFVRAFAYFILRYVLLGGFLDGKEGFLWHFLQGWWYRTLVDAYVMEIEKGSGGKRERIRELLRAKYGMSV